MKKIHISLSLFATLAFAGKGLAQTAITLSSTYLPQVGSTYNMIADSMPTDMPTFTVSAGSASAQTWSYTTGFNTTFNSAIAFVAPSGNPGASNFPSATLASNQGAGTWGYLTNGSNGLYLVGVDVTASGVTIAIPFSPAAAEIPIPFTYSNTTGLVVYTGTASATVSGMPVIIKHRAFRAVTADAFGTITTPVATYSNTLRVYTHETYSDSVFLNLGSPSFYQATYDTTINYSWYQNATNALVVSLNQKPSGLAKEIQYLAGSSANISSVKQNVSSINLYPNPAKDEINLSISQFDHSKANSVEVYNTIGECVHRQTITSSNSQINVSNLAEGVYNISIISGEAMINKRLVIVK
ncbi:MAG: T9SS type A sorting domain-containing protein [Bacteroidia bacterium]